MDRAEAMAAAGAAAGQKDWSRAVDLLDGIADSTDVMERRAFYLSRAARYREAIELLEQLRERDPRSAKFPYMIGYQFAQQEEWGSAIAWYERALRLKPNYLKALYRLAQANHRADRKIPAQIAAGKVVRLWHAGDDGLKEREAKKFAGACHLLAKAQLHQDPEGAVELVRQAVEQAPGDVNHHYLLGKALTRAGQAEEALESLRKAKSMDPGKGFIDIELIRATLEAGDETQALERLRRDRRRFRAWDAYNAGRLAQRLGDSELAREFLERANRRGPTRRHELVERELQSLPGADVPVEPPGADEQPTGEIVYLNPKRGYGFLVDENGIKRHFRLDRGERLSKGRRVTFAAREKQKGPAADDVRTAS